MNSAEVETPALGASRKGRPPRSVPSAAGRRGLGSQLLRPWDSAGRDTGEGRHAPLGARDGTQVSRDADRFFTV